MSTNLKSTNKIFLNEILYKINHKINLITNNIIQCLYTAFTIFTVEIYNESI